MNEPQPHGEVEAMRRCVREGRPYGGDKWIKQTMAKLGWREPQKRGRPKKRN